LVRLRHDAVENTWQIWSGPLIFALTIFLRGFSRFFIFFYCTGITSVSNFYAGMGKRYRDPRLRHSRRRQLLERATDLARFQADISEETREHSLRAFSKLPPFIGRDARGYWVVRDRAGLRDGRFVDRSEALRFAMLEDIGRPSVVLMIPGVVDFSAGARVKAAPTITADIAGANPATTCDRRGICKPTTFD